MWYVVICNIVYSFFRKYIQNICISSCQNYNFEICRNGRKKASPKSLSWNTISRVFWQLFDQTRYACLEYCPTMAFPANIFMIWRNLLDILWHLKWRWRFRVSERYYKKHTITQVNPYLPFKKILEQKICEQNLHSI